MLAIALHNLLIGKLAYKVNFRVPNLKLIGRLKSTTIMCVRGEGLSPLFFFKFTDKDKYFHYAKLSFL